MKRVILIWLLVFSYSGYANYNMIAIVHNQLVEYGVNEIFSSLKVTLEKMNQTNDHIRNAYLKIDYRDYANQIIKNEKLQLSYNEIDNCFVSDNQFCTLDLKYLSQIFKSVSCKLEVTLFSSSGQSLSIKQTLLWGDCMPAPTIFDPKRMVDIFKVSNSLSEMAAEFSALPFSLEPIQKLSVEIMNQGKRDLLDEVKMLVLGEDQKNNIIWASSKVIGDLRVNERRFYEFTTPITQKTWHQLCRVRLVVDSRYKILEENKDNNEQVIDLGLCETASSFQNGGRIDFRAWIKKESDKLVLYFFNMGNLDFDKEERVQFSFVMKDKNGSVREFSRDILGEISAYGDYTTFEISQDFIGNKCKFTVHVNPFYRVNESDFTNNVFELNICN